MHAAMGTGRLIAGRYRLQGPVGRGAMGIVWRGRDELLARDVAVKEVQITAHASPSEAEAIYQRTLREARTAARLKHPGVVTVYDVVEEGGSPWIVMEMVEARSLDRIITEDGPLSPPQAAELGSSLVGALASAHAAGVLHRDVKPSNVLVTHHGKAVLTDFGIATFAEDPTVTHAGLVVGTPGFTAPERVRGEVATPASDLWSVGATLYAAVEGRGPFDRAGSSTVITAGVATEDAPRAPSAGPLGPVIDALLRRDPGSRPDAATVARLLSEAATAARTGARALADGWLAAAAANGGGSPASAGYAAPASDYAPAAVQGPSSERANDQQINQQHAAVLAPPVFAELSMPDTTGPGDAVDDLAGVGTGAAVAVAATQQPVRGSDREPILWQPLKSPAGGTRGSCPDAGRPSGQTSSGGAGPSGSGAPSGPGGPSGSAHGNGWLKFWNRSGPSRPSSGGWRWVVAGAGIAAIVVAALVGWDIYSHTKTTQALNASPPGTSNFGGSTPSKSARGGSAKSGGKHGSTAPAAGNAGGFPASAAGEPSRKPTSSANPSASSTHGSAPASPSASPTPPTRPTGPVLPPGYAWHDFSAAQLSSTAGFEIGLPKAWTQNLTGQIAHFNQPVKNFHLTVNVGVWTYPRPLAEAAYLQKKDAAKYNGYAKQALSAVGLKAIGGFRAAPAAELEFSWDRPSAGNHTELVILVSLATKAGVQSYTFTLWAPSASFRAAHGVFLTALTTFRPLPAA